MASTQYEAVIGLEVHAQLSTRSKAFCSCTTTFGGAPNTQTCPVCLGHPGAMPVLNKAVVDAAIAMGIATHCSIRPVSTFSRKNYFYPDLPKGYQITQYEDPICYAGFVEIELEDGTTRKIGITRIHMEEDAGKSIHDLDIETLIDLNRAGTALLEIVSGPDIRTGHEAYQYLMQIRQMVTYLGICDGNMEEGSLRCDANISVRPVGQQEFGTKTEVKNLNSFRNVEKAIAYEIERQIALIESGGAVQQETRMWDAAKLETRAMRTKEFAHDYRYFPEPDLTPVHVGREWVEQVHAGMPELGLERKRRFVAEYGLPAYDAGILTAERATAEYFEACCAALPEVSAERYKLVSNWVMTEILRLMSERKLSASEIGIPPAHVAEMVDMFATETISSPIAKSIWPDVVATGTSPRQLVQERGLQQISDPETLRAVIEEVIAKSPDNVEKYKAGKASLFGFFVGQTLKATGGKANPRIVNELLQQMLPAPDQG